MEGKKHLMGDGVMAYNSHWQTKTHHPISKKP
jgi:hypothetical protein